MLQAMALLILLGNLIAVNPDFSQGLNGWDADAGWKGRQGQARLALNNTAGDWTRVSNLCSDPVARPPRTAQVTGAVDYQFRTASHTGYVFFGVKWLDAHRELLGTEMLVSSEGHEGPGWKRASFRTTIPAEARHVSLCAFAGAYAGQSITAWLDNAYLEAR